MWSPHKVASRNNTATKAADVTKRPQAFHHVGLLVNEPPGMAGLLFIQSSDAVI